MSDQGFSNIEDGCLQCIEGWKDGKPIHPKFIHQKSPSNLGGGPLYYVCPMCKGYYGEVPEQAAGQDLPAAADEVGLLPAQADNQSRKSLSHVQGAPETSTSAQQPAPAATTTGLPLKSVPLSIAEQEMLRKALLKSAKPVTGEDRLVERLHDEADIQKRFNWQRVYELLNEAASRISELQRQIAAQDVQMGAVRYARDEAEALAKANQEDAEYGALMKGKPQSALEFIDDQLAFWAIVEELEALRRGIPITHGVDPLIRVKEHCGPLVSKEYLIELRQKIITIDAARGGKP